jgi:hypothetical protein
MYKSEHPLRCNGCRAPEDEYCQPGAADIFAWWPGAKYGSKALNSCRAELVVSSITITISIARRRPPKF